MLISNIIIKNWRNFKIAEFPAGYRVFIVGPNAAGKSNLLDALRFLRDITKDNGGLQTAIDSRGGISKLRCLSARTAPDIEIEVAISQSEGEKPIWRYALGIKTEKGGNRKPVISFERAWSEDKQVCDRPDKQDKKDPERLKYTYLEQVNANQEFRPIASFLKSITYIHLVPQLVRHPWAYSGPGIEGDPFGRNFLERIAEATPRVRESRLRRIQSALSVAVPQLAELHFIKDETTGLPHLQAKYNHWRPRGAYQREDQFSDGTLRLIGLLWALQDGDSPLLLEEPELSLHGSIASQISAVMHRLQKIKKKNRQLFVTTHSLDILADKSIDGADVLLVEPTPEGSTVRQASSDDEIKLLLEGGMSAGEAVIPLIRPKNISRLSLLD